MTVDSSSDMCTIKLKDHEEAFGKGHKNCWRDFSTKLAPYQKVFSTEQHDGDDAAASVV